MNYDILQVVIRIFDWDSMSCFGDFNHRARGINFVHFGRNEGQENIDKTLLNGASLLHTPGCTN